jgi:hypothetical protein
MRNATAQHPNVNFIAVSHSDQPSAEKWLEAIGGPGELHQALWLLLYAEREIFAKWGLGAVSWGHVLSLAGLLGVWKIGKEKGIWNRPTESGSRWQCSGHWATDGRDLCAGEALRQGQMKSLILRRRLMLYESLMHVDGCLTLMF